MAENNTYISNAPKPLHELLLSQDPSEWEAFLSQPVSYIIEAATGVMAAGASPILGGAVLGRVLQGAMRRNLLTQLGREFKEFRKAGKIKEPKETKYGYECWTELLTLLDSETPDAERMEALKAMFFAANSVSKDDASSIVEYQLFQIAKRLASGDLLILKACFQLHKKGGLAPDGQTGSGWARIDSWTSVLAAFLGEMPQSLIEFHADRLEQQRLLSQKHPNQPAIFRQNGRLSDLGLRFCQNLERYDDLKSEVGIGN